MKICIATWHGHCKHLTSPLLSPTNLRRDNDIEGIIEPNFAVDDEKFGERRTIDLIPGGEDIPVTNENKGRYVE